MDMTKFAEITPLWTPQQQLEFAIGFADRPLSQLTTNEWIALRGELSEFCRGSEPSMEATPTLPGIKREGSGRKAIVSLQAWAPANYSHLVLLARNKRGYKNLIKLSSAGYVEGYYRRPRIDKTILEEHAEAV